eukprot:1138204-Pelagomonas_calceolata.AAC.6
MSHPMYLEPNANSPCPCCQFAAASLELQPNADSPCPYWQITSAWGCTSHGTCTSSKDPVAGCVSCGTCGSPILQAAASGAAGPILPFLDASCLIPFLSRFLTFD